MPKRLTLKLPENPLQLDHEIIDGFNSKEHYIPLARKVCSLKKQLNLSERDLAARLNISKTEIHRMVILAEKTPTNIQDTAVKHCTDKYVLLDLYDIKSYSVKYRLSQRVLAGRIVTRGQFRAERSLIQEGDNNGSHCE